MDPNSSSGARKRSRPLHQQSDSTSPLSNATSLSSSKRRKLDINGSSPSTPNTLQAIKSALGGVFGFGRTKENVNSDMISDLEGRSKKNTHGAGHDINELDELLSTGTRNSDRKVRKQQSANGMKESIGWHTQADDKTRTPSSTSKPKRARLSDITVEPESAEDELNAPSEPPTEINRTDFGDGLVVIESHSKRKLKRPSKTTSTDMTAKSGTGDARESSIEEDSLLDSAARSSGRERRRPRRYSSEILEDLKPQPKGILTPSKKRQDRPKKSVTFGVDQSVGRTSGEAPEETPIPDEAIEAPILVKRKRGRPRKVTALESPATSQSLDSNASADKKDRIEKGNQRALEIKVDTTPPKKLQRPKSISKPIRAEVPEDLVESDEDDTKCVICGGGDSEEPNEIVLCDNCDLAAHQQCYGVSIIPDGDWLCRDCRPDEEEETSLLEMGSFSEPILDLGGSNVPDIEQFEFHLQVMQKLLLDKLTGRRRLKLYGLDEEYRKVHQVVEQTVLAGEGNSMLLIGARGSGKSTLVESVIADLSDGHRENFHVIRLNGFIHTDDKLALREIWRQLGREMDVDDSVTSKTNNYADTLTSLLALLSHPSEILEAETDQTAKSVIFILDEFDLFASHPRQTLLYNLFDIAQARKAPIAVLGITTKIDVAERLEKRVKSRFSHRYVHLPLPRTLAAFWEICKQGLLIDMNELVEEGFDPGLGGIDEFQLFWKSMVNNLYGKDAFFKHHLQTHFYRSKSVSAFLASCILPIANLTPNSIPLTGASFISTFPTVSPPDSKLHLLQSLADLDLALLIAAARLNVILDADSCNFAMAYDEYSSLTSKHKIQTSSTGVAALGAGTKVWGREVAMNSWERLIDCELLIPAGSGGIATSARDVGREVKMWRVDVALEEISGSVEGLSGIMSKWCREI